MSGRTRRVLLEEPAAGNLHGGVCGRRYPGGATVDLNGHEAGNGGHSQGKPKAYRDSSTRRDACQHYASSVFSTVGGLIVLVIRATPSCLTALIHQHIWIR